MSIDDTIAEVLRLAERREQLGKEPPCSCGCVAQGRNCERRCVREKWRVGSAVLAVEEGNCHRTAAPALARECQRLKAENARLVDRLKIADPNPNGEWFDG